MGDPSVPDEQQDIENILASDSTAHGPGDLDNLPESNTDVQVEDD